MVAATALNQEAMHYGLLIVFESTLLTFLQKSGDCLSNFQARKLCHAGTGCLLLQLDSRSPQARWFVYLFGIFGLVLTWELIPRLQPFRWGRKHDVGMTVYSLVAMLWFWLEMPVHVLAPMFFADPAGAIVGRSLSGLKEYGVHNPIWWQREGVTKTVGGSAAVLFFTAITFAGPATLLQRLVVGAVAVLAEALGGAYDNLLLVLVVVGLRSLLNFSDFGTFSLWAEQASSQNLHEVASSAASAAAFVIY